MSDTAAVLFDLGDTLVERTPEVDEDSIRIIALATGNPVRSHTQLDELRYRLKAIEREIWSRYSELTPTIETLDAELAFLRTTFYPAVLEGMGLSNPGPSLLNELAARQLGPDSFRLFPDVADTLKKLKARGCRLGCISNSLPSAELILQRAGLADSFDVTMLSHRANCWKPGLAIHERALAVLNVLGQSAVFIDDRPDFVLPVTKLYRLAILLDRDGSHRAKQVCRIEGLAELLPLLDREQSATRAQGMAFNLLPCYTTASLSYAAA